MKRIPFIGALLAAAFVLALLHIRPVPLPILRVLDGKAGHRIDVDGGLRAVFRVANGRPDEKLALNLEERARARGVDASARVEGGGIVLEVPGAGAAHLPRFQNLLGRGGRLEFKVVAEDTDYMRALARALKDDPRADELGITADIDGWFDEQSGNRHMDVYLKASERGVLEAYLAEQARPPEGLQIAFEQQRYREDQPRFWRTYLLHSKVELGSADVANAEVTWDPTSNRPQILVTFSSDGGRRFGELTARIVGRKLAIIVDGSLNSAPVVQSAIRGGRCTITMGAGDLVKQQAEAEDLAGALRAGPLPAGVEASDFRVVAPRVAAHTVVIARLACALLAGLFVFLILFGGRRLSAQPEAAPAPAPVVGRPWLRLLVTLSAPVVLYLGHKLLLPGINADELGRMRVDPGEKLSVFALGVVPLMSAFWLVEVAALIVPPWRKLRLSGPSGRARLAVATALVGLVLAALQAWFIAVWMQSLGMGYSHVMQPGLGPQLLVTLTLVAGTFSLAIVAALISRFGLANGYSVLLLTDFIFGVVRGTPEMLAGPPAQLVVVLVAAAAITLATVWILRARAPVPEGPPLRLPASGIVPLADASSSIFLVNQLWLVGVAVPQSWIEALIPGSLVYEAVHLVIFAGLAWFCVYLFTRHRRAPIRLAVLLSATYLVAIHGIDVLTTWLVHVPRLGALGLGIATAIVMDLGGEWRARARADLVNVWPLHRVQEADSVAAALAAAGIPVHLRGARHRTMLQFFGPFVPIGVLVPRGQVDEALGILRETQGAVRTGVSPEK